MVFRYFMWSNLTSIWFKWLAIKPPTSQPMLGDNNESLWVISTTYSYLGSHPPRREGAAVRWLQSNEDWKKADDSTLAQLAKAWIRPWRFSRKFMYATELLHTCKYINIYLYVYIYIYLDFYIWIYTPRAPMTSIFEGQPPKIKAFSNQNKGPHLGFYG